MSSQGPTPESNSLQDYLESSEIIDWHTPDIRLLADVLVAGACSDVDKAKRLYEWVRDEIPHSADAGNEIVTCRASEVLRHRTGICYAKAHLLAAVLRAAGIPAGLCYQVLRYDASSKRLVAHGLNGIYLGSLGRWPAVISCRRPSRLLGRPAMSSVTVRCDVRHCTMPGKGRAKTVSQVYSPRAGSTEKANCSRSTQNWAFMPGLLPRASTRTS